MENVFQQIKMLPFACLKSDTIPTYNMRGETGPVEIEKVEFEKDGSNNRGDLNSESI